LSLKVALLLVLAFLLIAAGLMLTAQPGPAQPMAMPMDAALGALGLALLIALGTLHYLVRRIGRTADALAAWRRAGPVAPLQLPGADAGGDELARLSAQVEGLAQQTLDQHGQLQQADRRRSELLANVSHDLRTPLASMQGYIELLLLRHGSLEPAEERNYLQTAARQSQRLSRLVGDLFDLTRLEAGEMQPQAEDFVLAELAQDVAQKFGADATRRGVRLDTRCSGAPVQVRADLGLVARVLESLVENALRHTPAGGTVTITIDAQGPRVGVAVRDTGAGIAAEDLPGIFERYDRAARLHTAGSGEHAGLGLAIARRIVCLHGAELAVQSQLGHGTQVSFDLAPAPARGRIP